MTRAALLLTALLLSALLLRALALVAPAAAASQSELRITYWAEGRENGTPLRWSLECGPAGGSMPRSAVVCGRLASLSSPFALPPKDQICTELYGGPQEAIVAGSYEGRQIWIHLARRNGCEIARFTRLRFLLPAFRGSGGPA